MDNENYNRRPRKRVSRKIAQQRRITALIIIILVIVLGFLLLLKSCTKDEKDKGKTKLPNNQITTTTPDSSPSVITTTEPTTTTPVPTADPNNPNTITNISLTTYSVFLEVGQKTMPIVTMTPASSTEKGEIWTSSDESIATVDSRGDITGVSGGKCTVRVTSKNNPSVYADVEVTVTDPNKPVTTEAQSTTINTGTIQQTSEKTTETKPQSQPSNVADSEVIEGRTYIQGVLIANKSYSLPADYAPQLDSEAKSHFDALADAAAQEGLNIYLSSGYRSYSYQQKIYNNYSSIYGASTADTFSARPGYSEHQTGLAIDVNSIDDSFAGTPEAKWLAEHCHEFGFIIRYPADKVAITGYKYEPWHIRYLGTDMAGKVYKSGLCLEEYLGIDSKYSN